MKTLSAAVLGIGLTVGGCSEMSDTSRRTLSGAGAGAAGGAVIGSLTGDFGWGALIGAGVGAAGGYLYDQHKQDEQAAYQRGLQEGRPAPR
ncbi:hypothetical protein E0493_20545 [Roseomonas sp. M0104]|uniref:Glycine zipper domain-containing protein n=2 Tax=Teichococcus coralli TaxID=2545983 RepID=A0A845BDT0_9PROT|nr:hypothetical protein [Pseudoroseomonas coralli]